MKKLYLHVGCGKTGSSALQVWLSQISKELRNEGVHYPLFNRGPLAEYTISSGNGEKFLKAIKNRSLGNIAGSEIYDECSTLLYSSEVFQTLTEEDSKYLLTKAETGGYQVHIIAYVRDVYDIAYSSFQQLVKRHTYTKTFLDFALSRRSLQQFAVIEKFSQWFEHLHVIHYDTIEGNNISIPFCRRIGIGPNAVPRMTDRKVNRSLSVYETELMRLANRLYMETHGKQSMRFSASLSDQIISMGPEKETEILFDQRILDHFTATMSQQVNFINSKFFEQPLLKILRKEGKCLVDQVPVLPPDLQRFISILIFPHKSGNKRTNWIEQLAHKFRRGEQSNHKN